MVKIVILGSCRYAPYEILAMPNPIPGAHNTEEGYQIACKKFYPAIDAADIVLVYAPDGKVGEHTARDIEYAMSKCKELIVIPADCHSVWRSVIDQLADFYKRQKSKRSRRVPNPQFAEVSPNPTKTREGDTPT